MNRLGLQLRDGGSHGKYTLRRRRETARENQPGIQRLEQTHRGHAGKDQPFADVTGDHQWIHVDIERAKRESPFKAPVAHGFLTLSLIPAFEIPRDWNVIGFRNVVNYGANKLRFISPVPAGSKVHARSRVVAVDPRPQGTQVTTETQVSVVGQDKPALLYEGIFLYVK